MFHVLYCFLLISAVLGSSVSLASFPDFYLFHFIFSIVLFLFVCHLFLKGRIQFKTKKTKKYLLFFLVWSLWIFVSFLWAEHKASAIKFSLIYAMMFLFSWLLILYNGREKVLKNTLKVLFFMFLVALFIGTLEAFTAFRLPISPYSDTSRYDFAVRQHLETVPTSFFYNPNNYATFLAFSLPFVLFAMHYASSVKTKIVFFLVATLTFINTIMTGASIGILTGLVIFCIYFLLVVRGSTSVTNRVRYLATFFVLLCVLIWCIASNGYLRSRFEGTIYKIKVISSGEYSLNEPYSLSIRATILNKIFRPPTQLLFFRGHGVGNTINYLYKENIPRSTTNPHNWWFELFGDFGVFFLSLYFLFFFSLLKSLWRIMEKSKEKFDLFISSSCFLSLVGFMIASMGPSSIVYFIPHWILIGLSIITINLFQKKKYENPLSG